MGSLGAIYKPETVCPFALTSCHLLKPDFVPFWFKCINPISLGVLHDFYNGSLYVLLGTLTLASCLKWIFRGSHIVPEALHPIITNGAHSGRVTQMERVVLKQFMVSLLVARNRTIPFLI
jgi:hypothetical protein